MLAGRLEHLRRELAEAEHGVAAERSALQRAEAELQARVAELEGRAAAAERELESERAARERAEQALALVRIGHRKLEALVADLKTTGARLRAAAPPMSQTPPSGAATPRERGPAGQEQLGADLPRRAAASAHNGEMVDALAAAVERLRARVAEGAAPAPSQPSQQPRHKHSMSLIARARMARKQRRQR